MVAEALKTGRFPYLPDLVSVNRAYITDDAARVRRTAHAARRHGQPPGRHSLPRGKGSHGSEHSPPPHDPRRPLADRATGLPPVQRLLRELRRRPTGLLEPRHGEADSVTPPTSATRNRGGSSSCSALSTSTSYSTRSPRTGARSTSSCGTNSSSPTATVERLRAEFLE